MYVFLSFGLVWDSYLEATINFINIFIELMAFIFIGWNSLDLHSCYTRVLSMFASGHNDVLWPSGEGVSVCVHVCMKE